MSRKIVSGGTVVSGMTSLGVPIGVALWPRPEATNAVTDLVDQARTLHGLGADGVWFGQRWDHDAATVAAVVGAAVPGLRVGTSIVPTGPRHPLALASQAQTAQAASGGTFTLGLGVAGPERDRGVFGVSVPRSIRHLREVLTVLGQYRSSGQVDFDGEDVVAHTPAPSAIAGGLGFRVLVAALGTQSLRVAGELADGTIPFLTGPRTIENRVAPGLSAAAGGEARTIAAGIVAVVTDDVERVRTAVRDALDFYTTIPSYRAVFEAEGIDHPAELALIGDEDTVAAGLRRYVAAGATEVYLTQTDLGGADDQQRTWKLISSLRRT